MADRKKPTWKSQAITFLIFFVLIGMLLFRKQGCAGQQAAAPRPPDARVAEVKIERWHIQAEVADTPELRAKGLSGRAELQPGYGMLYVYEIPQAVEFNMRGTTIPLSVAFIREDGTIAGISRMMPDDLTIIPSPEPVKYALEVQQGWFENRGVKAGTPVEIGPVPTASAEAEEPQSAPSVRTVMVGIAGQSVEAEVADTPELRRQGLMHRTSIEPGHGMLFVFDEPAEQTFWMKDTPAPLSIAFIREDGTIALIARMQPLDETGVSSGEPVKYTLEVPQGWFEEHGISAGMKVELPGLDLPLPGQSAPIEDFASPPSPGVSERP